MMKKVLTIESNYKEDKASIHSYIFLYWHSWENKLRVLKAKSDSEKELTKIKNKIFYPFINKDGK